VTDIPAPQPNREGVVTIKGKAEAGSTLTADITDADGFAADKVQYQWLRDGQAIGNASGSTYTLGKDDIGHKISVRATYKDNAGHDESPLSEVTATVVADTTPPVLTITAGTTDLKQGETTQLTFTFSEPVRNFAANDIVTKGTGRLGNDFTQVDDRTYTVSYTAQKSGDITVNAGALSDFSGNQNQTSSIRIAVADAGEVSIEGEPKVGAQLTAVVSDDNGVPADVQYQWYADGVAIQNATAATYTLLASDKGKVITVRATYTDNEQYSEAPVSRGTAPIQEADAHIFKNIYELRAATGLKAGDKAVIVDFDSEYDDIALEFTVQDSLPDKTAGTANRLAQPLANGKFAILQTDDYTLPVENSAANVEAMLAVAKTYLDAGDALVWNADGGTPLYTNKPAPVGTINGHNVYAITCSAFVNMVIGGWKYEDTTYNPANETSHSSYGWGVDFNDHAPGKENRPYGANRLLKWLYSKDQVALYNGDAANPNYKVGDILFFSQQNPEGRDLNDSIYFMNAYHTGIYYGKDAQGRDLILHSAGTYHGNGVVVEVMSEELKSNLSYIARPHLGNSTVTISGEAEVGNTLTATVADVDGLPDSGITYQWYADNRAINGATGNTYTLSDSDKGKVITVRAKFTDDSHYAEAPTSAGTAAVAEHTPPNQPGSIAISGEAKVGSTLTATITDSDGVAADKVQYQWLRDGQPIDKANGSTYTLSKDDAGHKITVQATYKDNAGHDENPQDSITTEAAATNKIQVSNAAAVSEGNSLHYTIKLDAPAQAGQTLKISASHHNSAVEADKLAQTADPFQPGEYLGNGTVFTRSVANMPLADNSAAITQYAPSMAKNNYGVVTSLNHKSYNIPIYIVDSSDPKQHYATITSDDARVNASADIKAHTTGKIPLPEYATPAGGGDKSFAVYDKATGLMREYFYAVKQPDGSWKVSAAGYFQGQAGLDDLGVKNYWMQHEHGGSAVVRMLNPLSQIGISEILAGRINHAVSVTLPNAKKGVISFPAQDSDGTDENPNAPAEGQWFRIKPGVDLDTYTRGGKPLGELTKMIAKAVQTYGGYGADKNLNNFAFNAESAHNYLARGKEDPWREGGEIAQKVGNMNINDFPWELVEWAPVGWNDKGQDAGVYSNTQLTASINGQEVPITGGEITLPAGATEVHVNVPTLTHNNFEQTDSVTLNAELHDANGNLLDSGAGTGQVNDAPNPIADSTHGNGVLISPNVNPDELAKLVSLDGQELIDYIDQHGHNILQNVQNPTASPVLRGGDGDDILVSGYGVDHLAGGKGADTFVYIMDGKNSFPYQNNDQILDFNPAEGDRIVLTRGDGWTLQFDKVEFVADAHVQRLQYKVYKGTEAYINAIHIQSHDGHLFGVEEIMKAVTILG